MQLADAGIESGKLEAEMLAAHALHLDRPGVLARLQSTVETTSLDTLLGRRLAHEPLAYILGWREFRGLRFAVNPSVLIPRQETETILDWIDSSITSPTLLATALNVIDIGTGSGCLAIAIKHNYMHWQVTGIDISPLALSVAQDNARNLGASVNFVRSSWLDSIRHDSVDLIVSNPPYIAREELLPIEVSQFEPETALFSGETGLESYESISPQAFSILRSGGHLAFEIGFSQANDVAAILAKNRFEAIEVIKDLGCRDRVVAARKP